MFAQEDQGITQAYISDLRSLEKKTRATIIKVMPETQHTIMFHFLPHLIDCIEMCGSVRNTWCFRGEREIGVFSKKTKNWKHVEQSLVNSMQRGFSSRKRSGLSKRADKYLKKLLNQGNPNANSIFQKRVSKKLVSSYSVYQ